MHVLAVEDEKFALELLVSSIMEYDSNISIHMFRNPVKALEFAKTQNIDAAFLDLQMFEMNGLKLAEELIKIQPRINIIFTTGYEQYAIPAFKLRVSGYILKPVTPEKVKHELANLRYVNDTGEEAKKEEKVAIRCFGNFEIFVNGEVINFKYSKTKEMLAYLVDRKGASCSNSEISTILWESGKHDSYLRNIRKDLIDTLHEFDCDGMVQTNRGKINICMGTFDCDYYKWLEDNKSVLYQGEYMAQYSWAELTNAWLLQQTR